MIDIGNGRLKLKKVELGYEDDIILSKTLQGHPISRSSADAHL
jgi:hypothetical protein